MTADSTSQWESPSSPPLSHKQMDEGGGRTVETREDRRVREEFGRGRRDSSPVFVVRSVFAGCATDQNWKRRVSGSLQSSHSKRCGGFGFPTFGWPHRLLGGRGGGCCFAAVAAAGRAGVPRVQLAPSAPAGCLDRRHQQVASGGRNGGGGGGRELEEPNGTLTWAAAVFTGSKRAGRPSTGVSDDSGAADDKLRTGWR